MTRRPQGQLRKDHHPMHALPLVPWGAAVAALTALLFSISGHSARSSTLFAFVLWPPIVWTTTCTAASQDLTDVYTVGLQTTQMISLTILLGMTVQIVHRAPKHPVRAALGVLITVTVAAPFVTAYASTASAVDAYLFLLGQHPWYGAVSAPLFLLLFLESISKTLRLLKL
ncbi:hypothetical protein AB0G86_05915 [Streptomyces scabiei]|uniref:hypothetical protein n=1 Tax=Streptomyces scabiei TaxID=1930 RepID=UPI0033F84CD8